MNGDYHKEGGTVYPPGKERYTYWYLCRPGPLRRGFECELRKRTVHTDGLPLREFYIFFTVPSCVWDSGGGVYYKEMSRMGRLCLQNRKTPYLLTLALSKFCWNLLYNPSTRVDDPRSRTTRK
jgi:hypothetical protein